MKLKQRVRSNFLAVEVFLVFFLSFYPTQVLGERMQKQLCLKAYPKPECQSFLITEFSYMNRFHLSSKLPSYVYDDAFLFSWELGLMKNITPRYALGGTFYTAVDDEGSRVGIKARIRRWLSRELSIDLAPGILIAKISGDYERYPAFTGHIGFNYTPMLSVVTQLEIIPFKANLFDPVSQSFRRFRGNEVSWFVGIKLCSEIGVGTGIVGILLVPVIAGLEGLKFLD